MRVWQLGSMVVSMVALAGAVAAQDLEVAALQTPAVNAPYFPQQQAVAPRTPPSRQVVPRQVRAAGKVRPGLVSWHPDVAAAKAAAASSGKPVLVFLLLGKLDDQFC